MNKKHLDEPRSLIARPAIFALAVAVLGVLAMLIVDHGPWTRPKLQTAEIATYKTTGEAAHAARNAFSVPGAAFKFGPRIVTSGRVALCKIKESCRLLLVRTL